jgi:hypothetical protein
MGYRRSRNGRKYRGRWGMLHNFTNWAVGKTAPSGRKIVQCPVCGRPGAYQPSRLFKLPWMPQAIVLPGVVYHITRYSWYAKGGMNDERCTLPSVSKEGAT